MATPAAPQQTNGKNSQSAPATARRAAMGITRTVAARRTGMRAKVATPPATPTPATTVTPAAAAVRTARTRPPGSGNTYNRTYSGSATGVNSYGQVYHSNTYANNGYGVSRRDRDQSRVRWLPSVRMERRLRVVPGAAPLMVVGSGARSRSALRRPPCTVLSSRQTTRATPLTK